MTCESVDPGPNSVQIFFGVEMDRGGRRSSRSHLRHAIDQFAGGVRQLAGEIEASISSLQRTVEMPPSATGKLLLIAGFMSFHRSSASASTGREAKLLIAELVGEIDDMSQGVQHLQRFSVDSISFEV